METLAIFTTTTTTTTTVGATIKEYKSRVVLKVADAANKSGIKVVIARYSMSLSYFYTPSQMHKLTTFSLWILSSSCMQNIQNRAVTIYTTFLNNKKFCI